MADDPPVTDDDVGQPVVDDDGTPVAVVADVTDDAVLVTPDPDVADDARASLGWETLDRDYRLDPDAFSRRPDGRLAVALDDL